MNLKSIIRLIHCFFLNVGSDYVAPAVLDCNIDQAGLKLKLELGALPACAFRVLGLKLNTSMPGSDTHLLVNIGTITINTFLPQGYKFVYSCSVKIPGLGFDKALGSISCILLTVLKVVRVFEDITV